MSKLLKLSEFCRLYQEETISYYSSLEESHLDISPDGISHDFLKKHVNPADKVLEVGCGQGNYTFDIAKYCRQVDAIDIIQRFLDKIKERSEKERIYNINIHQMNIYNSSLPKNYDRIIFTRTMSQLSSPRKALLLSKEKLKNSGTIILIESELYPDPSGSFYPSHLERVARVCEKLGIDLFEVEKETLIPFNVGMSWIEKLAEASDMRVGENKYLGTHSYFDNESRDFIVELFCE